MNENYLEQAADLFTKSYKKARENQNILPVKYEDNNNIFTLLQDFSKESIGVVAVENSEVIGYLTGLPISNFKGSQRGIYCPEWSHAVRYKDRLEIYQKLYEEASDLWVQDGCLNHAITIMAHDDEAMNSWFWNGFGLHVVDAVRDLNLLSGNFNNEIEIRKFKKEDTEEVAHLYFEYKTYMASSPIYLPLIQVKNAEDINQWLLNPDNNLWLCLSKNNIIAIMEVSYKQSNDAQILSDDDTVSIGVTYTSESYRGQGFTKALLQKVLEDALLKGYKRCAVVFESQNDSGRYFWLKYFKPVCYSLVRKVDNRILDKV
ncbi:GNAT family N-acetyltransferase [Anaerocolumna sp. MB42-C2]|uniref:GNAT family N-acetyltransferase n=1 Tax=Anaerocolumna sp. MB42-C2 TaxID=3070997 RepID=UPI0027E2137A|nr:GNAT family N-acetyltransferase [Anaerocolumna sp. MB42-C2]WMJ87443.1 GNAT family N-acetyltransferase [Anaerocolumna sp. MB42-C2]